MYIHICIYIYVCRIGAFSIGEAPRASAYCSWMDISGPVSHRVDKMPPRKNRAIIQSSLTLSLFLYTFSNKSQQFEFRSRLDFGRQIGSRIDFFATETELCLICVG